MCLKLQSKCPRKVKRQQQLKWKFMFLKEEELYTITLGIKMHAEVLQMIVVYKKCFIAFRSAILI